EPKAAGQYRRRKARRLGVGRMALPPAEQLLGGGHHMFGLEPELLLQLFQRRRGAERFHADDSTRRTDIALPSERRCLLDRDPRLHVGGEDALTVLRGLVLEDVPRR